MLPVKLRPSDPDYEPDEALKTRKIERVLKDLAHGTDLLEQHERNEQRRFHAEFKAKLPTNPIVLQMEQEHPFLLEPKEPHRATDCPSCQETHGA